jgi:hypothetical protein
MASGNGREEAREGDFASRGEMKPQMRKTAIPIAYREKSLLWVQAVIP